jgi:hypothetical protein
VLVWVVVSTVVWVTFDVHVDSRKRVVVTGMMVRDRENSVVVTVCGIKVVHDRVSVNVTVWTALDVTIRVDVSYRV